MTRVRPSSHVATTGSPGNDFHAACAGRGDAIGDGRPSSERRRREWVRSSTVGPRPSMKAGAASAAWCAKKAGTMPA
jgi:hypothetical protein